KLHRRGPAAHDSEPELPALLASVARHLPGARVVVADSGSRDRSAALARAAGATVVELPGNVGFGRASNAALERVEEPVTVLANPDVELVDGSLAALAAELRAGPERLLAPAVLNPDGSRQDTAHPRPGSAPELAMALIPPAALPAPLRRLAQPWRSRRPGRVGWLVGCCLVARTETLRRLGPFDERIFMYGEDLDLGLRAADAGIECWYWPAARVLHAGARSAARAFGGEPLELLARQRRAVIAARLGRRAARLDDAAQALTFAGRALLKRLLRRGGERERRQLAALRAARRQPLEPVGGPPDEAERV
ncbi:MAG: glycosyltransferase family 2 protein, partial [Thermoleophilaceae bacterium]|nr:glycosyltransferase family 2 protein [Thermoleophilaceae bacterium]